MRSLDGPRVLLVEDNAVNQELAVDLLTGVGRPSSILLSPLMAKPLAMLEIRAPSCAPPLAEHPFRTARRDVAGSPPS